MNMKNSLFWFRRDLRLQDNIGLFNALNRSDKVACVFVFDKSILTELGSQDMRVDFIWNVIKNLKEELRSYGSDLIVVHDNPEVIIPKLAKKYKVTSVYTNEDYEPKAIQRDRFIEDKLKEAKVSFNSFKDQAIFAKNDILSGGQKPYVIYSRYANAWKNKISSIDTQCSPSENLLGKLAKFKCEELMPISKLGFEHTKISKMKIGFSNKEAISILKSFCKSKINKYNEKRDFPSDNGVSYLGVHNRFGTISVRALLREALDKKQSFPSSKDGVDSWVSEIIWRDFYFQIIFHFPGAAYEPFQQEYQDFPWENDMLKFQAWCMGKTGYPLIDAAMTQLNETGYMHNRLRMLVASFLTKHLLVDYRLGEQYFASKLLDFDLSANNGGWQWSASTGCDAQPYFRIFNPILQSEKFDPEAKIIKKFLPIFTLIDPKYLHSPWLYKKELEKLGVILGVDYPLPIVDHKESREKVLAVHKQYMQK